ncbi:MAG: hypothetical protein C4K47_00450 [Candidatus Thorarchaeota archaeon]|nr:MAG: hypothetical protein C4K47_00450 [Candidatus Thorarchaeota archaeon]
MIGAIIHGLALFCSLVGIAFMSAMASAESIRVCGQSTLLSAPSAQTALLAFCRAGDGLNTDSCVTSLRGNERGMKSR